MFDKDLPVPASPELQPSLQGFSLMNEAVEHLASRGGIEQRGAVYTKRAVVDFILDLSGYQEDKPLTTYRLLEPSFGNGDFLIPAIQRLLKAAKREGDLSRSALAPAVRAIELHRHTSEMTRALVAEELRTEGFSHEDADSLCDMWLSQGDFLLADYDHVFSHIVGNPPYVRQEAVPDVLMAEYRQRYKTIYDRADIYIPFIERSLSLLADNGKLGFICADRWMKNKYGKKLRELVSTNYALTTYIDMYGVNAFHEEVSAYPAITIIAKEKANVTRVYQQPDINASFLQSLAAELTADKLPEETDVREIAHVTAGNSPWVLNSFDELALVRRLESQFPALEEVGCKVGIGVATGADKAFIGDFERLDVEASRKLPIVMTRDLLEGHVAWRGKGIINPFADDGKLVELDAYPMLRSYLEARRETIAGRHVATKNPRGWYRTIDRIYPALATREKLLIPDIKSDASIVYEPGEFYPHHNLYYIISDEWDLHALQAVMRSGIARLFVALYCTRMRGGSLRFQAQYLRKIRIPRWREVSPELRKGLVHYAQNQDRHALNEIVSELYGLSPAELKLIEGTFET